MDSSKCIDPGQPAQSAQADLGPKHFAIYQFSAYQTGIQTYD